MRVEDRRFWGDLDLRLEDQGVFGIAQGVEFIAVVALMLANPFSRSGLAWIHQPEGYLCSILRADSLDQR